MGKEANVICFPAITTTSETYYVYLLWTNDKVYLDLDEGLNEVDVLKCVFPQGWVTVRYSEILGLYENFKPAYDLTDEIKNGWKQFIPVDSFIDLLSSFLEALESSDQEQRIHLASR